MPTTASCALWFLAHPPADCELKAGAVAAMWAKLGHKVKFVSTVNPAQPNSKKLFPFFVEN